MMKNNKQKIILPLILMMSLVIAVFLTSCSAEQEEDASTMEVENILVEEVDEQEIEDVEQEEAEDNDNEDLVVTEEEEPSEPEEDLPVEELAPDFTISLLGGGEFTLSEHRGTVVVLSFWASWCGPCVAKMPSTQASYEYFGDQVIFLGINIGENPDLVQEFIEEGGYTFPIGLDEGRMIHGDLYPSIGIPFTVVIDREGVIVGELIGWTDAIADELYAMIEGALQ